MSAEQDPAATEQEPIELGDDAEAVDHQDAPGEDAPREDAPGEDAPGEDVAGEDGSGAEAGTSLEARPDALPELAAPHRAGAIVSEFVASIVEEAQARAAEVAGLARDQVSAERLGALDSADRMRAAIDAVAADVSDLLDELRSESKRLAALRAAEDRETAGATRPPSLGEEEALAQVAAGLERGERAPEGSPEDAAGEPAADDPRGAADAHSDHDDGPEDVELVEDSGSPATSTELEPRPVSADELAEDQARFARMSDEELARAYSNAVGAYSREDPEGDRASRLYGLAAAALGEALARPSFEDDAPGSPSGGRFRGRRRRRRAAVVNELRAACREARATMAAEEAAAD